MNIPSYLPQLLLILGTIITGIGGILQYLKADDLEQRLLIKTEELTKLTKESKSKVDGISDKLTGGDSYPSFGFRYHPMRNKLYVGMGRRGKNKLPYKRIKIFHLSAKRSDSMIEVTRPAKQFLLEQTKDYLEFYIEGSTTGKLMSHLFEIDTEIKQPICLIMTTESENGMTKQLYYIDNFRDNARIDEFKYIEGIGGIFDGKELLIENESNIKLYDSGLPIKYFPALGGLNIERDWENRKDVQLPKGWSRKK